MTFEIPNGTILDVIHERADDVQVCAGSDPSLTGWVKRWNLQMLPPIDCEDAPALNEFSDPSVLLKYCSHACVKWLKVGCFDPMGIQPMKRLPRCQDVLPSAFCTESEMTELAMLRSRTRMDLPDKIMGPERRVDAGVSSSLLSISHLGGTEASRTHVDNSCIRS